LIVEQINVSAHEGGEFLMHERKRESYFFNLGIMNTSRYKISACSNSKAVKFLNKGKKQGFTLIELLVALIIIGVLSTIALPSFLNAIGKSRGSEAKANLGTINRAQQVYRFDNQVFSPDLSTLSLQGINVVGKYYLYSVTGGINTATASATPNNNDLKAYASGVVVNTDDTVKQVICESLQPAGAALNSTAVTTLIVGSPGTASCASGSTIQ
jgi:type IV pilus assembly protein PilA